MKFPSPYVFWLTGLLLLVMSGILSLCLGTVWLTPSELGRALLDRNSLLGMVVLELRLPRTILALAVGAGLGLTGAALQGYTRNPLADSGLLGINAGAALGAVLIFYTGFTSPTRLLFGVPLGGLMGAGTATILILLLTMRVRSIQTLILAGVAVSALCGALTSLVLNLSPNPFAAQEIIFWLLGSVADRGWNELILALPLMLCGAGLLLWTGPKLRVLSLGEDTAATLGVSLNHLRFTLIIGTALVIGPSTAVTGAIGFIGLVVPHLLRPLVRHDPATLLPASAVGGALLLIWADITIRLLPLEQELKLGVITALLGAPFFFLLIFRLRRWYP